tara:strand:- start:125 stop:421 length:297 start_codon:yes stop_codon:yes gene_type:complete
MTFNNGETMSKLLTRKTINTIRKELSDDSVELFYQVLLAYTLDDWSDNFLDVTNNANVHIHPCSDEERGEGLQIDIEGKTYRIYEDTILVEQQFHLAC